jgi:hypothetical protein
MELSCSSVRSPKVGYRQTCEKSGVQDLSCFSEGLAKTSRDQLLM